MHITRPKPRREHVRLEVILREPKLQLRSYPDAATFDAGYVEKLLELLQDGVEFEPIELVEEQTKGQPKLWLIDGFNRCEAFERAGTGSVEALIYPGTFKDAELWSLASNSRHGQPRTPEDCRKAFDRLVNSVRMLEEVITNRSKYGGTERALAVACGLSHGVVGKYLRERNLRVDRLGGKLIPADGPISPERDARKALVQEATEEGKSTRQIAELLGCSSKTVCDDRKSLRDAAKRKKLGNPVLARAGEKSVKTPPAQVLPSTDTTVNIGGKAAHSAAADELDAIQREFRSITRRIESLLGSPISGKIFERAKANGVPLDVREEDVMPVMPQVGDSIKKRVVTWPALASFQTVFLQVAGDLAAETVMTDMGFGRD